MWSQLIKMRLKPGKDADLPRLVDQLQATEQSGSGLVRSTAMRDQSDPSQVYFLATAATSSAAPRSNAGAL